MLVKLVHIAAAIGGVGFSFAILAVRAQLLANPSVGVPAITRLSRIAYACLILLWITGIWMMITRGYGALGMTFALKMLALIVLTAAATSLQYLSFKGPQHPFPVSRDVLSIAGSTSAALVVIFAVMTFS